MANSKNPELDLLQIKADIFLSEKAIEESKSQKPRFAKFLRGQAAYHLQQATEKLIKIQLYNSKMKLDNAKIYKHGIGGLLSYSDDMGINIFVPASIRKNDELLTSWEAEGRYDVHVVVRTNTLQKYLKEITEWFEKVSSFPGIK